MAQNVSEYAYVLKEIHGQAVVTACLYDSVVNSVGFIEGQYSDLENKSPSDFRKSEIVAEI